MPDDRVACKRHEGNAVIAKCLSCGEGVCRECREEFGYFCSKECLEKVKGTVDPVQKAERKKVVSEAQKLARFMSRVFSAVAIAIVLILAYGVWSLFLAPYGKLAWSWNGSVSPEDFIKLGSAPGSLFFISQGSVVHFDAAKGRPFSVQSQKELAGLNERLGDAGDLTVLRGERSLGVLDSKGALLWRKDLPGELHFGSCSEDVLALLVWMHGKGKDKAKDEDGEEESGRISYSRSLMVLNPADGSVLFERKLPPEESLSKLAAGPGVFAAFEERYSKDKAEFSIKVFDAKTGASKWQVKPKSLGSWGPEFLGSALAFSTEDSLNAVKADGSGKLWSLPLKRYGLMSESVKVVWPYLVASQEGSLSCVDLESQKVLWSEDPGFYVHDFEIDSGRVYLQGSKTNDAAIEVKDVKLPDTMEGLKDEGLSKEGLAALAKNVKRSESALAAFDLKTGKLLWQRGKAVGRLVCGDGRLVLATDTAKDTMISMIGGTNKGDACVFQIDPASGADIVNGRNPIGLTGPYSICGNMLVGIVYDRDTGGPTLGMGKRQQESFLGLAAFRLK